MNCSLTDIFDLMLKNMGPQGWWPADSKTEIILGAILVQNTNWKNVTRSLNNLQQLTAFNPEKVVNLSLEQLQQSIRPSGFFINKAKAIKGIFTWLARFDFDFIAVKQHYGQDLRLNLLNLYGIGPETADTLLLYVFDIPVFIADKYTQKLFARLGIKGCKNYAQLQQRVQLPANFSLQQAQELHALIDEFGKKYVKTDITFASSFLVGYQLVLE